MRRRFVRRFGGTGRPTRVWASLSGDVVFAAVSATTTSTLIQLQAPASLASLTSDPPEDMTVLRLTGAFTVTIAGDSTANWTLALLVQDTAWTPGATFSVDADKRILWHRTYQATNATSDNWRPPGTYSASGAGAQPTQEADVSFDIAPKVRIEAGKALFMVAYENVATSGTLTMACADLRVLFQRSQRRR